MFPSINYLKWINENRGQACLQDYSSSVMQSQFSQKSSTIALSSVRPTFIDKSLVLVIGLFFGLNIGFIMLVRKASGSLFLAIFVEFSAYYWLIRKAIIWTVFPGSSYFFKRSLELNYMTNMGSHVLEQIREFRSCLDIFKTSVFHNDAAQERTRLLAITSAGVR